MGQKLVEEFITPEHRARVQSVIDQALAGEETANFEFPLMTKAGVRLEVLLNATTRRDEQGSVIGVVGIGQDITGRLAQEREYTRLIDTANAPIFGVDVSLLR
jgi:PAS domain S-box-containing protein